MGGVSADGDTSLSLVQFRCPRSTSGCTWGRESTPLPEDGVEIPSLLQPQTHFASVPRCQIPCQAWDHRDGECHTSPGHIASGQPGLWMLRCSQASLAGWGIAGARGLARSSGAEVALGAWGGEWQGSEWGDKVRWRTSGSAVPGASCALLLVTLLPTVPPGLLLGLLCREK